MQTKFDFTPHPNSLNVYINNVLPELSKRESDCLNALRYLGEATVAEVATHMRVFHHTISGRFTALKEKGRVKIVGLKRMNGRPHDVLKVVE